MPKETTERIAADAGILREAIQSYLAPPHQYAPELGEALLLQLVGGAPLRFQGANRLLRRDIHVLVVTKRSREEAMSIVARVTNADPARSELVSYGEEDSDWITSNIRRSEGWKSRRKHKQVTSRDPIMVEGGVAVTGIVDRHYHHIHDEEDDQRGLLYAMLRGDEQYVRFQRTKTRIAIPTRCAILGIGRAQLSDKRHSLAKPLIRSNRAHGLLREFDLVLPLNAVEQKRASTRKGWTVEVAEDDLPEYSDEAALEGGPLDSADVLSWISSRRSLPPPSVPQNVRDALAEGLDAMTERWRPHGSRVARAVYGIRAECSLLRLTIASAKSWGRRRASAADAKTALSLTEKSWRTIASFEEDD